MSIDRKNHTKDHIVERTALPDELIRGVTGQIAFKEQSLRVRTLDHSTLTTDTGPQNLDH